MYSYLHWESNTEPQFRNRLSVVDNQRLNVYVAVLLHFWVEKQQKTRKNKQL